MAHNVYKTSTVIKHLGTKSNPLASVTLSMTVAKTFLREALTTNQLRIEIWKGEGGKKNASKYSLDKQVRCLSTPVQRITTATYIGFPWKPSRSRRTHLWERRLDGSPYCLCFEARKGKWHSNCWRCFCRCFGAGDSGFSVCGERYVFQCRGMRFGFCVPLQLLDNEHTLQSLVIQLGVKECLVQGNPKSGDYELVKLYQVLERCNVVITERKACRSRFASDSEVALCSSSPSRVLKKRHCPGCRTPDFRGCSSPSPR